MTQRALDDYVNVHTRVELFRKEHPEGSIITTVLTHDPVVVRAQIQRTADIGALPWATGTASAEGGMGHRDDSAYEKAETAAVGRALAFCGYEVKAGIASQEEMQNYEEKKAAPKAESKLVTEAKAIGEQREKAAELDIPLPHPQAIITTDVHYGKPVYEVGGVRCYASKDGEYLVSLNKCEKHDKPYYLNADSKQDGWAHGKAPDKHFMFSE